MAGRMPSTPVHCAASAARVECCPRRKRALVFAIERHRVGIKVGLPGCEGKHRIEHTDNTRELLFLHAAALDAMTDQVGKHARRRFMAVLTVVAQQLERPALAFDASLGGVPCVQGGLFGPEPRGAVRECPREGKRFSCRSEPGGCSRGISRDDVARRIHERRFFIGHRRRPCQLDGLSVTPYCGRGQRGGWSALALMQRGPGHLPISLYLLS